MSDQPLALEYHGKAQAEGHWRRGQVHKQQRRSSSSSWGSAVPLCNVLYRSAIAASKSCYFDNLSKLAEAAAALLVGKQQVTRTAAAADSPAPVGFITWLVHSLA
jgi:hypothetical protein